MRIITKESIGDAITWDAIVAALEAGHRLPKADISDQFLEKNGNTLLSRAAWIDGLGFGVKSVSVFPENHHAALPTVNGAMLVFEDRNGTLQAIIDNALITNWKTAADSVLGARLLARPDSKNLLIVGAGSVAEKLAYAYTVIMPSLTQIDIWNRTQSRAEELANKLSEKGLNVRLANDLSVACESADIVSCATMATEPVLKGEWVTNGTHVDLIGAFKPDMREADDALLQKSRLFVDSFETTIDHIGELKIPLAQGAISRTDVLADLYDLVAGKAGRQSADEITVFKNGGGAHLDLMTAKSMIDVHTV